MRDGTYQESITIPEIAGATDQKTITFTAENALQLSDVTLEASGAEGSEPLRLDGADHLRFKRLSLTATRDSDSSPVRAAYLKGEVTNVHFNEVRFLSHAGNRADNQVGFYAENNTVTTDLHVTAGVFGASASAVYLRGDNSNASTETLIQNNVIGNDVIGEPTEKGIELRQHDGVVVTDNLITGPGTGGIEFRNCNGAVEVTKNDLDVAGTGINMNDSDGASGDKGLVANNEITSGSTDFDAGLRVEDSAYQRLYHNSVNMTGDAPALRARVDFESLTGTEVRNNVFVTASEVVMAVDEGGGLTLDYNGLYTTGPVLVDYNNTDYGTLSAYQSGTGQGANAQFAFPAFESATNLRPDSPFFDDQGTDLTSTVGTDIRGNSRATPTSMGAHEYAAPKARLAAGTYTVGPAPYPTLDAVVDTLKRRGIGGSVTFEVEDDVYGKARTGETLVIPPIGGANASNTVTVTSKSGDASGVNIQANGSEGSEPLRLNGADYFRFETLTLNAVGSSGAVRAAYLKSRLDGVEFADVRFLSHEGDRDQDQVGLYAENNTVTTGLTVTGSVFGSSTSGIYLKGDNNTRSTGTRIENNVFSKSGVGQPTERGIFLRRHDGATVTNNAVGRAGTDDVGEAGIQLDDCNGAISVTKNDLSVNGTGINLERSDATSGSEGLVANNEITSGGNDFGPGIRLRETAYQRVYHNSVNMTGDSPALFADAVFDDKLEGTVVKNNVFAASGKEAMLIDEEGTLTLDYNDLYTTGPVLVRYNGTDYGTLADYQSNTGQGANSVSANPNFASDTDLTPTSTAIDDEGEDLTSVVPDDINGTERNTPPSIGAIRAISQFTRTIKGEDGTGNDDDWRMLSVPAANATRSDLADDITVETASGDATIYRWEGSQWTPQTQSSAPLPRGFGFILYVFDDPTEPLTSTGIILDVPGSGADRTADVTLNAGIKKSEKFEVLGNPYNVAYDLAGLAGGDLAGAGFQATVQVWNPATQRFKSFTQGFSGDEIPAWNSFILERSEKGSGQSTLTFSANGKQSSSGALLGSKNATLAARREASPAETDSKSKTRAHAEVNVDLTVTNDAGDTLSTDRAILWLDESAQAGWDGYDATDFAPPASNSYATATFPIDRDGSTTQRMLASEPYPNGGQVEMSTPLSVGAVDLSGTATLSAPEALGESVPDDWTVRLRDTQTGETVNLPTQTYTFSLGEKRATDKASGARFRLEITTDPLPVELAQIEGAASGDEVVLQWKTASETNNAGFTVQRQRTGDGPTPTWTDVGFVEGSGTTSEPQSYRLTDTDLPYTADTLRYRLRQVDTDGSVSLSESVVVDRGAVRALELLGTYPNPARQTATVRYAIPEDAAGDVTLRLYDVLGRRVRTVDVHDKPGRHKRRLNVSGLGSGVYFLRLQSDGAVRTQKLTVVQ